MTHVPNLPHLILFAGPGSFTNLFAIFHWHGSWEKTPRPGEGEASRQKRHLCPLEVETCASDTSQSRMEKLSGILVSSAWV